MNVRQACASALIATLTATTGGAAEQPSSGLDYELRAGATYSDNIFLQPGAIAESASALAVGADLRGEQTTGRLRYNTGVELWYYQYLDTFSGGQLFGRGVVSGSYDFVPDHFRWNAGVNFDQQRADLARPLIPGNVEDLWTLSTGPTVRGTLFGAVDTQLDAHIVQALYSGDSFDNQTVGGRLTMGRRTGPLSSLGLGASYDDVTYLSGLASSVLDFERREVFVHGEMSGARTDLSFELGYADAVSATFDDSSPLARIRLERRMSPALTGYLGYRHEFPTSQVNQLISDPTPSGGGVVDTGLVTSSPRETWTGEAGFRFSQTRSEAQLGYYHLDEHSLIEVLGDHRLDELRARVTRHLTPRSDGTLFVAYAKEDFTAFNQKNNNVTAGLIYSHEFTRSVGIDARFEYRNQNSNVDSLNYNEFNGGVFLRYSGSLLGRSVATPRNEPVR